VAGWSFGRGFCSDSAEIAWLYLYFLVSPPYEIEELENAITFHMSYVFILVVAFVKSVQNLG
jgi:hypothetical protein